MRTVRTVLTAVAVTAVVAFGATACSGDEGSTATTSTTVAEDTTGSEPSETVTTLSPEEFDAGVEAAREQLRAAGTDQCAILTALVSVGPGLGEPTATSSVQQVVEIQAEFLRALAGTDAARSAGAGDTLRTAADQLVAEVSAAGYTPEALQQASINTDPAFTQALGSLQQNLATSCPGVIPGAPDPGAPDPGAPDPGATDPGAPATSTP